MSQEQKKLGLLKKITEHLDQNTLGDDLEVTYRVSGGMPSQYFEHKIIVSGTGRAIVSMEDVAKTAHSQEKGHLEQDEVHDLLRNIAEGADSLISRSEARFLPDSLVGTITIKIEGHEETYFFHPDEKTRAKSGKPISKPMVAALKTFSHISEKVHNLSLKKEEKNEKSQC